MADYKAIQGYTVEKLSSDPSPVVTGKLFYNDTSNVFKIGAAGDAAWATTNTLTTGTRLAHGSAGAAGPTSIIFAGSINPPAGCPNMVTNTEEFDGTNWTEKGDMNTPRELPISSGTNTAALGAGGYNCPGIIVLETELWNGLAWTASGAPANVSPVAYNRGSGGTQTSTLAYGGSTPPFSGNVEEWDGSTWTETTNLNTARQSTGGAGSTGAPSQICMGGVTPRPPPPSATGTTATEQWNGTSWTTVPAISRAVNQMVSFGTGTAALRTSGYPTGYTTETWNGTSWTETSDTNTNLYNKNHNGGGAATTTGMMTGGYPPTSGSISEEWSYAPIAARTVTTS